MRRAAFGLLLAGCVGLSPALACNATAQQLQATADDALKVGMCILGDVLGGQTDALRVTVDCAGATPALIIQVIDDFTAPKADAGAAALNVEQGKLLARAKQSAMQSLAAKLGR